MMFPCLDIYFVRANDKLARLVVRFLPSREMSATNHRHQCCPTKAPQKKAARCQAAQATIMYCQHVRPTYTPDSVTFHWKSCRFVTCAALLAFGAGCSGINSRHSVSPASFFLPGLLKADPPEQVQPLLPGERPMPAPVNPVTPEAEAFKQVALAR
jgi:hypothetical protein